MTERSRGEGEPKPESLEEQKYAALLAAQDEEDRIMKEIDQVFATTTDRMKAEMIVLEKWATKMYDAMEATRRAYDEWQKTIEDDQAAYEREIGK